MRKLLKKNADRLESEFVSALKKNSNYTKTSIPICSIGTRKYSDQYRYV